MNTPYVILVLIKLDPSEWKAALEKAISQDLNLFYIEMKNSEKNIVQGAEDNKMQERIQIRQTSDQLFFSLSHFTLRLCELHSRLKIPLYSDKLDQLFQYWEFVCKTFGKYTKYSEQSSAMQRFGYNSYTPLQETEWSWLHPEIIKLNTTNINKNSYIHESLKCSIDYFAEQVLESPRYCYNFFDILINVLEKDCTDEEIALKIVKAARRVLLSNIEINLNDGIAQLEQATRENLIPRLHTKLQSCCEKASNEILELIFDYLMGFKVMRDHQKKLLNYGLFQLKTKGIGVKDKLFELFDKFYGRTVYNRIEHVFVQQIWDYGRETKDNFWIQQALELLLSSIDENGPMKKELGGIVLLSTNPSTHNDSAVEEMKDIEGVSKEGEMKDIEKVKEPEELKRIISGVEKVTNEFKHKKTKCWLRALKSIANTDLQISEKLWLKLFPQFWNNLSADDQQQLASTIEPFLTHEDPLKQNQGRNFIPIKTMFETVSTCDPLPRIAPEIIIYLAKNYCAWHIALPLLESYIYAYPDNTRYILALASLLKQLGETDYLIGLERYVVKSRNIKAALSYSQVEMWNEADNLLTLENMKELNEGNVIKLEGLNMNEPRLIDSHMKESTLNEELKQLETRISEEWFTEVATALGNWEYLKSVGAQSNRISLILQSHWGARNWKSFVEESLSTGYGDSALTVIATLYEQFIHFVEDDNDKDETYKKLLKAIYKDWTLLPNIIGPAHYKSLVLQQQFTEVGEFRTMYREIREAFQRPELRMTSFLNYWRNRLPNKAESFVVWRDLLESRNHLFEQIKKKSSSLPTFDKSEPHIQDIPWNLLKLAKVARKHGLVDQAYKYLSEADKLLQDKNGTYNYENFLRVSESAKMALGDSKHWEQATVFLQQVETKSFCKNNEHFLSEIKRLNGEVLCKLGKHQDAYNKLEEATKICSTNYKAWESLGLFYESKHEQIYNSHALKAYLHVIIYKLSKAKLFIPKILQCLEKEVKDSAEKVFKEMNNRVPIWIWIYWIPELLNNLERTQNEREVAKIILKNIATLYPQALFVLLKDFQNKLISNKGNEVVLLAVNDIFAKLQERGDSCRYTEKILNELEKKVLISRSKEAELLLTLKYLHSLCIPIITLEDFSSCISKIAQHFFLNKGIEYKELQRNYSTKFFNDFAIEVIEGRTVIESIKVLRNWIDTLHTKLTLTATPTAVNQYSHELADLKPKNMEMFGVNYVEDVEPTPEKIVHIANIDISMEKAFQRTRVIFCGTNNKDYSYYLTLNNIGNTMDEVMKRSVVGQNAEVLIKQAREFCNKIFSSNRLTMSRNIKLYTSFVFCWNQMRVSQSNSKIISMATLHDAALIEKNMHPDHASIAYFDQLGTTFSSEKEVRKAIAKEMCITINNAIFTRYIHRLIINPEELFAYKKQFTIQLASQSFFTYLLSLSFKGLDSLLFCKNTGKIIYESYEFTKEYTVPFRLTPNLEYFVTPIGVEGVFAGVMTLMAKALKEKLRFVESYLKIYYRDMQKEVKDDSNSYEKALIQLNKLIDLNIIKEAATKEEFIREGNVEDRDLSLNHEVYEKIREAKDVERLSEMPLEWAPWF